MDIEIIVDEHSIRDSVKHFPHLAICDSTLVLTEHEKKYIEQCNHSEGSGSYADTLLNRNPTGE